MKKQLIAIAACLAFTSACQLDNLNLGAEKTGANVAPRLRVIPADVRIVAEDGSFEFKDGKVANTPQNTWADCGVSRVGESINGTIINNSNAALLAKDVEIYSPVREKPYAGRLVFCDLPSGAVGPGARSVNINVSDKFLRDEISFGVSGVVFEWVTVQVPANPFTGQPARRASAPNYILWVYDSPEDRSL